MEPPIKIVVCKCRHCKAVKNKTKNRKLKKKIKRLLNKKRRVSQNNGRGLAHYWA